MKNFRYILVGFITGGAFGAKIGEYLSATQNAPSTTQLVESGFIYGSIVGIIGAAIALSAIAISDYKENAPQHSGRSSFSNI